MARPWRVTTDCIAFHVSSTSMCGASAVGRRLRVWLLIHSLPGGQSTRDRHRLLLVQIIRIAARIGIVSRLGCAPNP